MTKVLLTGGAGFVATHIISQLLERGHKVVTTVRSKEEEQVVRDAHKDTGKDNIELVIVPDMVVKGAFDEAAQIEGLGAVLHIASPFFYDFVDAQKELVDPAVYGTTWLFEAIHRYAPTVKRIIMTSSFASVLDEDRLEDPSTVFTEKDWNPVTMDEVNNSKATAYRVSKKFAERAAWDFVAENRTIRLWTKVNTSNSRMVDLVQGKWKEAIPDAYLAAVYWIDVRDLALTHILGMEKPEAGGRRLMPLGGRFGNRMIADIVWKHFPELREKLPGPDVPGGSLAPADQVYRVDNTETKRFLGIEWREFETAIVDCVDSLKPYGI
ncbi:Epimerase domain-containing protein [Fusarium falciforme]|uniref:Epimerase domain-containing protein n=1 Tax=Fusarium falciforme TaxID=195108 RepID=UPI00230169BE|nr:Epimerase domain-containing protein [Fusarium falciforme]WAO90163.1 Epimerase domain-containing protein [Fusarium falciforme]